MTDDMKPGDVRSIPLESITKEDFVRFLGSNPMERLMGLRERGSNRDLIIESVGMIDAELTRLLQDLAIPAARDLLFGRSGKAKDLELKTLLAFGFGLITRDEFTTINTLRQIRNRFAHDADLFHFEHDEKVLGYCRSLTFHGTVPTSLSLRDRVLYSALGEVYNLSKRRPSQDGLAMRERTENSCPSEGPGSERA